MSPSKRKKMIQAIFASPTYRKAYQDVEFLAREELRPVRLELELLKPELALIDEGVESTIVVFGSARILSPEEMTRQVARLRKSLRRDPASLDLRSRLSSAENLLDLSRYYEEARRFAQIATRASMGSAKKHWVVVTGGGPGIMEAANRGAYDAGGKSIGLNITLPHEQEPNAYMTPELSFQFHYFAIRKMHFLMRAKAMVAFPGGFGTLDELFESLTLVQTGKKTRLPIVLVGRDFWPRVIDFKTLADEGVISPKDIDLLQIVDTAEEAWAVVQDFWKANGRTAERSRRSFTAHREKNA
ncbi:MAG TPA: TIGR00730 family Rossman fold protein [Elusimicrobia bacterium]|nr:TIGR00730 family Rossman fold protein [Elusimicrobiota bacterium]